MPSILPDRVGQAAEPAADAGRGAREQLAAIWSAQRNATLPAITATATDGSSAGGVPGICRPAIRMPTIAITTIESSPRIRSTATEATASLPREVRCMRV